MRYKVGKLDHTLHVFQGDTVNLSIKRANNETVIHREEVQSTRHYTHWLFMEIEKGVGTAIMMGTEKLEEWFLEHFPDAVKLTEEEFLYV